MADEPVGLVVGMVDTVPQSYKSFFQAQLS